MNLFIIIPWSQINRFLKPVKDQIRSVNYVSVIPRTPDLISIMNSIIYISISIGKIIPEQTLINTPSHIFPLIFFRFAYSNIILIIPLLISTDEHKLALYISIEPAQISMVVFISTLWSMSRFSLCIIYN